MSEPAQDYSEQLDVLWNFADPSQSEVRFRAEALRHIEGSRERAEASTQIARAQGLQRKFDAADATLDGVAQTLDAQPARVRVRYLLERGRRDNSSGRTAEAARWFEQALAASQGDALRGAAYYRVDALHMLAIAAPPSEAIEWHRKALAAANAAIDARTRGWRASLLNNLGWTLHDRGDYAAALDCWRDALTEREAMGDVANIRIARWTVARGLRSLGRLDEAESIQRALAGELATVGTPDGNVFEELAEIALARGDRAAAQPWAAQAIAILGADKDLQVSDTARLARLADLAKPQPR
ncbi:MAG TPA: tetratricopeptide repeat protein [Casimicrobiaceae bacterium]|nr:tetratricopeptide repeat protein [Casimicrobiaceae bacterium]